MFCKIVKMAEVVLDNLPNIPQDMKFDTSKKEMSVKRCQMATDILEYSGMES